MPKQRVPVIVGPTAVGKTAVAQALAAHRPVTVISADSRQIYRSLDVGTAKPTPAVRRKVPHVGLDVVDPGERYSAGRFARDAAGWLDAIPADRQALVVGGTGFYVRALADGLFREPPMDAGRRARLREWSADFSPIAAWASRLDPAYSGGGRQRAARTVEVALLTGRPLSWWQREARADGVIVPWYVRLTLPRALLHRRIAERAEAMLGAGLVDEVRRVLAMGVPPRAPGLDAVGYRQVVQHLEGDLPEAALADEIARATRRYAKRQETWFRHQLGADGDVLVLDMADGPAAAAARILDAWEGKGS